MLPMSRVQVVSVKEKRERGQLLCRSPPQQQRRSTLTNLTAPPAVVPMFRACLNGRCQSCLGRPWLGSPGSGTYRSTGVGASSNTSSQSTTAL